MALSCALFVSDKRIDEHNINNAPVHGRKHPNARMEFKLPNTSESVVKHAD
jgi:hypothetical protein